jgi:hypothetical protein
MVDISPPVDITRSVDVSSSVDISAPEIQQQKGFFETLRNPIELMRYESLPVAGYQFLSGNTKEVQAKKAQDFIQANPNLKGTPEYNEAEAVLERYDYTLSQEPFSFEALQAAVKTNPGAMGAELVNAFMADPYLLFTPYLLGGNALAKFMQANNVLAKVPRLQRGVAIGTAAVPEAAAYSVVQQLGEKGELDTNRVAVETALGGAGGLGLGMVFGGSVNMIGKHTDEAANTKEAIKLITAKAEAGDEGAIAQLNDLKINEKGIPQSFDKMLDRNLERISPDTTYSNKYTTAIKNEVEDSIANGINKVINYNNKTTLTKKIYDMSVTPAVAGGVLGGGAYIGTADPEKAMYAASYGVAGVSFYKFANKALARHMNVKKAKDFISTATQEDFTLFRQEVKKSGINLKDTGIKDQIKFYRNEDVRTKDLAELGNIKRNLDEIKGEGISRYAMDDYDNFTKVGNATSRRLNELYNKEFPILNKKREEAVLDWIQGDKSIKLSATELKAATAAQDYFAKMHKVLSDNDLLIRFRKNFLPGFWQTSAFESEESIIKKLQSFLNDSANIEQYKGRLASENSKKINSYAEGRKIGLEARTTNLGEIISLYNNAVNRALGERRIVKTLFNSDINGRVTPEGNPYKFMYDTLPTDVNAKDYVKFRHHAFESHNPKNEKTLKGINKQVEEMKIENPKEKLNTRNELIDQAYKDGTMTEPFVYKEAAPHLKLMFDSTESKGLFRAISNVNFLQKRFSVGYSFFHAAALMESMIFAGVGVTKALNVPVSYFKPGKNSAKRMITEGGNFDDYEAGLRAGVVFSHPDDIGHHAFYDMVQGANRLADRVGSPLLKWTMQQGIDKLVVKPFKFIDDVTWDHVYNSGKLYTFQTARLKLLRDPKNKDIPLVELDKKAGMFTNEAYGGLNWRRLYENVESPLMKKIAGTALTPSGRRVLQLMMFAPDWTISNFRILYKALPGINKDPVARKLYQAYAIRAGLIYATLGSALQYMFTGKSLFENKDPTKIDLGNGDTMVFSKQMMEPLHWAVHPYKTLVSKQGSTLKLTQQLLFNKRFLTSPWPSPISEADLFSLYRARDYGQQIGESFIPFAFRTPIQQMMKDGVHFQDAINFLLGEFGHPVYPAGRQYKYPGLNIK